MIANKCKAVRREIDEANLEQQLSAETIQHLKRCVLCRGFRDERHVLRGLMAGFETVGAPPDFDFRLRARLARERNGASSGFRLNSLSIGARSLAAAALVLVVAVCGILLRSWKSVGNNSQPVQAQKSSSVPAPDQMHEVAQSSTAGTGKTSGASQAVVVQNDGENKERKSGPRVATVVPVKVIRATNGSISGNPRLAVRELAVAPAPKVMLTEPDSNLVVVPTTGTLKVTIDNGKGMPRTVSLPSVSFGSERLLAHGSSFVPVSASKGVW